MSLGIWHETEVFFQFALAGMLVILAYDMLRVFRRIVPHGLGFIALEDFLYWAACSIFLFQVLYRANDGIIRWFSVGGTGAGMLLYNFTISPFVVKYLSRLFIKVLHIVGKIIFVVTKPLRFFLRKLKMLVRFITKKLAKVEKNLKKILKKAYKEVRMVLCKH